MDVIVSSTDIILEAIEREVPTHSLTQLMSLEEKGLVVVDVRISPQSATVGKALPDLELPRESNLALIIPEEGSAYVLTTGTELHAGDQIIAVTKPENKEALRAALRGV